MANGKKIPCHFKKIKNMLILWYGNAGWLKGRHQA
jgi:hypothetical protein